MSFSYNPNLQADRDKVRFKLQITDPAKSKLQDEEIDAVLASMGATGWIGALWAAASIARSLHVTQPFQSVSALGTNIAFRDRAWLELAAALEAEAEDLSSLTVPASRMPYVGGISQADKLAKASDPDRVDPWAELEIHDNREVWWP